MPHVDAASEDSNELWPNRISPNYRLAPWPYEKPSPVTIVMNADSSEKLGDLLCKLVEWIIEPPPIDLTVEGPGATFEPPPGTTLMPSSDQIPPELLSLISGNASYSMYVRSV